MNEWLNDALCKGKHADLWFPPVFKEERTAPESKYYDIAKGVCWNCPIREDCAVLGEEERVGDQWVGVWGGWSPIDRKLGYRKPPTSVLPASYVKKHIPIHEADVRLDIPALKARLKGYTEKPT